MLIALNEALIVSFFTTRLQNHTDCKQWENQATNSARLVNCFKGGCERKSKGTSSSINKSNIGWHRLEIVIWQNEGFFTVKAKIPMYSSRELVPRNSTGSLVGSWHNKITEVFSQLGFLWKPKNAYIPFHWINTPGHQIE